VGAIVWAREFTTAILIPVSLGYLVDRILAAHHITIDVSADADTGSLLAGNQRSTVVFRRKLWNEYWNVVSRDFDRDCETDALPFVRYRFCLVLSIAGTVAERPLL